MPVNMPVDVLLKVIERRLDRVEDEVTTPETAADLKSARELVAEAPRRGEDAPIIWLKLGMVLGRLGIKFDKRMAPRKASRETNKAKGDKTKAQVLRLAKGLPDDRHRASKIAEQMGVTAKTVRKHIASLKAQGKL